MIYGHRSQRPGGDKCVGRAAVLVRSSGIVVTIIIYLRVTQNSVGDVAEGLRAAREGACTRHRATLNRGQKSFLKAWTPVMVPC